MGRDFARLAGRVLSATPPQECLTAILADGVVVAGSRSDRDRVRHPLWTPYTQCQQNLIRLARTIPLVDPKADHSGAALDFVD
jgi:hypothetical protein